MNRLQKKCFIASAGVHGLLALILFVGPAFLTSKPKVDDSPILEFIPLMTTDKNVSGGGDARAHSAPPPAPAPQPAATQPKPEPKLPDPPKEIVKPPKPEPDPVEPAVEPKKKLPNITTKPVSRNAETKPDAKTKPTKQDDAAEEKAKAEERARATALKQFAQRLDQAGEKIGNGVSGGTDIKLQGPGGGGVPYANFLAAVKSVYTRAWIVPEEVHNDEATVGVSVTIARSGDVIGSHVVRSSGDSAVDASVRATLDRVRFAAPLPTDATENQRTVTINFNVRAKRAAG